jgi:DNA helicase IV
VQRHPQADTRLHNICFSPTLKRHDTMPLRPIVLKGEQKRVLFLQVTDPIQIKGVAGSGKTTVALYRAKHLLDTQSNLFQEAKIAIFTYNKTLVKYINAITPPMARAFRACNLAIIPIRTNKSETENGTYAA